MSFISKSIAGRQSLLNKSFTYFWVIYHIVKLQICSSLDRWVIAIKMSNCLFIALIHPIQWTIAYPVGADRPAKRQKKTSCVSTGQAGPVLCTRQMACRTSFLSRQSDVIASFSFGACTVRTCFFIISRVGRKVCIMTDFQPYLQIF